jgi:uncharacterized protein (DUF58 family)
LRAEDFIAPETLADIQTFEWAVKSMAMGSTIGSRRSRRIGVGMEFSQYRPYSQGDDIRQLDWKMYARSGKYYIKESDIETHINVSFAIDQSGSMKYEENGLSKLQFASLLTGYLGYAALQNGDRIGIAGNPGVKPGFGDRHWLRFLQYLVDTSIAPGGYLPEVEPDRQKELFVIFSDLYSEDDHYLEQIKDLKNGRNEVILFHLLGRREQDLTFSGASTFVDLESGRKLDTDPRKIANSYREKVHSWTQKLNSELMDRGIDYQLIDFTEPIADIINSFLHHRKQLL